MAEQIPVPDHTHYTAIENVDVMQPYDFEIFAVRSKERLQYTMVVKDKDGNEIDRCSSKIIPWVEMPGHAHMGAGMFDGLKGNPYSHSKSRKV